MCGRRGGNRSGDCDSGGLERKDRGEGGMHAGKRKRGEESKEARGYQKMN